MSEHARLGPSNERWRHCPGSVREEAAYPDIPTAAAMDGTGTHLLLELCLNNGVPAEQYVGQVIGAGHKDSPQELGWHVDPDRARRVQVALDYISTRVSGLQQKYGFIAEVKCVAESKSNPGQFFNRDDWWGTCDVTITATKDNGTTLLYAETVDYKDGKRYVSEKTNQLADYLLGKVMPFYTDGKIDTFVFLVTTIVQPKTNNPVRSRTISYGELLAHGDEGSQAAAKTDDPNAPLTPGKHCFFCKHGRANNCDAQKQERIEKGEIMENNIVERVETSLQTMSGEELAKIIDAGEVLIPAIQKAKDEAQKRINAGQKVPNYFMGEGKVTNVWNSDDETIAKKLKGIGFKKDDIYPPKLVSPAQARKNEVLTEAKAKNLEKLITTMAGNKVLKKGERVATETKPDVKQLFMGVPEQQTEKPTFNFM